MILKTSLPQLAHLFFEITTKTKKSHIKGLSLMLNICRKYYAGGSNGSISCSTGSPYSFWLTSSDIP